jgi:hypothetical protein
MKGKKGKPDDVGRKRIPLATNTGSYPDKSLSIQNSFDIRRSVRRKTSGTQREEMGI